MVIRRDKFEELCQEIFERAIRKTKDTVKDAEERCGIKLSDIKEILLVGGSTRIPKIRQMLGREFPKIKLNYAIDADEAVAYGAAIRAAQSIKSLKAEISLTEATPLSLGINVTVGNIFYVIIPRNSHVPISKTENFFTTENNQSSITFTVILCKHFSIIY